MKLKFKVQPYQTHAVDFLADCFVGQPKSSGVSYVFTDSGNERTFVEKLDASTEVVVYAKLPKSFFIPTPVGNYNPDWAIAFQDGKVKHIYFIAGTKGSMSTMDLRAIEKSKIACAANSSPRSPRSR